MHARVAQDQVRTAELIAVLSLATDLGIGLPLEHGLHSTVAAMRLADLLRVDHAVASQTYYGCLLFYVGCTTDAEITAERFDEGALLAHVNPVIFGSPVETVAGIARALAGPGPAPVRGLRIARGLPRAVRGHQRHVTAMCEVARMLTERLGLSPAVQRLFGQLTERWDGKGGPAGIAGEEIPLPLRIIHVARDAALQNMVGGPEYAARVVAERAGHAFDPAVAALLVDAPGEILAFDPAASVWEETLTREPRPHLHLDGAQVEEALAAMGDFADLLSPYLVGHSAGVAELAGAAARGLGWPEVTVRDVQRAALVHDLGRVAVSARIWHKASPLTPDDRERVRLHPYHTERVLCRSPFLAALAPVAAAHHERLDGAGYHRGTAGGAIPPPARLLAAADAYHAMTEPRPYRDAFRAQQAAAELRAEAEAGRLDPDCVAAVLEAAGHPPIRVARPAGLTEREAQVVGLLARGLQTKQVARALGISAKTADRHVQNAYAKIGVSTRAAAALFAMQHGLATWGELPIARPDGCS